MRDSAKRIKYIADYLHSYKSEIESLNKNGLFDTATLYELFAAEVCKMWFGQGFTNLNTVRSNYPYVDLVSDDGEIYVQVSTGQDIPRKVKSTLENIEKSKNPSFSEINTLYFFLLGNDSIKDVPEYKGESRIGAIDFSPEEHLISIDKIISKAKTDYDFQNTLFKLLRDESKSFRETAEKLDEIVHFSQELIRSNVNGLINGEYEINRDALISKIRSDDCQYISIIGDAGSGKTALCKKLVSDEAVILFARAEKIAEVNDIDQIWGLSVSKILHYLNGKRIVFYVDALEFIADGKKTNIDLLQHLYALTRDFKNARIITSCRTSDKNAYLRLTSTYGIREYTVPELTDPEITQVACKYSIIDVLRQQNRYSQLLKSPFYLNMIVEQIKSADDLVGTNGLREYIWDNVICLKNKALPAGITSDEIQNAVNTIVFTRAKEFLIGIPKDDIPNHVLKALVSNGVVLQTNNKLRLTYDIFEDICFEQRFDREFDRCKGDYCAFFTNLTDLGRCVYRRYQIWVENKLFIKEGRESFLYSLVFSEGIPENWKKQTIIGITKSRFCKEYFHEYGRELIEKGLIAEFFEITNLYSFESSTVKQENGNHYALLRPVGVGREQLIQLARNEKLYEKSESKRSIIKMCKDYAKSAHFDELTAKAACSLLEVYIDQEWQEIDDKPFCQQEKVIKEYLASLYLMAKYCAEWVKEFLPQVLEKYRAFSSQNSCRVAGEILLSTIKNSTPALVAALPDELKEIAWAYWVEAPEKDENPYRYSSLTDTEENYGLNENAAQYSYIFKTTEENVFLKNMSLFQFPHALLWAIDFINYSVECFRSNKPNALYKVDLVEFPAQTKYTYWGRSDFFFAGVREYMIPTLLGDIVYTIRQAAFMYIGGFLSAGDQKSCARFVYWIRNTILGKTNNTILLGLLEDIGLNYSSQFPDFSIIFASSMDYVMNDTQREAVQHGVKMFFGNRYQSKEQTSLSLKEYVLKTQLFGGLEEKALCEKTLDYLYSVFPNDEEHARENLQIQKMDLRKAKVVPVGESCYVYPQISGEAEGVVERFQKSKTHEEQQVIDRLEGQYKEAGEGEGLSLEDCIYGIEKLETMLISSDNAILVQGEYIKYIASALRKDELDQKTRSRYCMLWIDALDMSNENGFGFDLQLAHILFEQAKKDLDADTKASLKKLFLSLLIYQDHNGLVSGFGNKLKQYLASNERWAKLLFNTILELARDEMAHNMYNADFARLKNNRTAEYQPNISPRPLGVDYYINEHGGTPYQSQKEIIIQKYLLNEEKLVIAEFDINQYDISVLCHVANCGLSLSNEEYSAVIKAILHQIIEIWCACDRAGKHSDALDGNIKAEIRALLIRELLNPEKTDFVIDLLFSEIDSSRFVSKTYDFYEEILVGYLPYFFDAYDHMDSRQEYKKIAEKIERRIQAIPDENARIQLSRVMFLPLPKFYGGDWTACKTRYSYSDKQFINSLWEKYGQYHLYELITAIYELKIGELLPEVLPSICLSFYKAKEECTDSVENVVSQHETRINALITTAFVEKEDQIKQDSILTESFESLLELLVGYGFEIAAVILDEFRVH